MTGRSLLAAVVLVAFTAPALAFHCPKDVAAIDAAMAKGNWTEAQKAAVTKLRDEGDALHKAGKHKESVDKLSEAMRAMLNSM
jgi:hypothetical protein